MTRHLVPFGEYVPEWLNWNFLADLLQEVGVYTPGRSAAPLVHEDLRLGMLICYEAVFPWLAQARVEHGANVLVDISNDGWFGRSPAALQHLYLASLRAVEQGRWLLRGTSSPASPPSSTPAAALTVRGASSKKIPSGGVCACNRGPPSLSQARALAAAGRPDCSGSAFSGARVAPHLQPLDSSHVATQ